MSNALAISGGSTKIPMLAGAAITALKYKDYNPSYIIGTSSGGILALPLALGLYDKVESLVKSFTLNTVFDNKPVNEEGKVTLNAKLRVLAGKESLGTQNAVIEEIKKIVPKYLFKEYKKQNYPVVYLGVVEFRTGRRFYINLKEQSYENYLKFVLATGSIPGFVEGVRIVFKHEGVLTEGIFYDGGTRDHIGSAWFIENHGEKIDEMLSIYSRPRDYKIEDMGWYPKNVTTPILRAIDIMMTEISKSDQELEELLSFKKTVKLRQVFFPYVASSMYEIDPVLLEDWYNTGVEELKKIM
jgi:predicted acylesterase/phospholipase RssA